MQKNYRFICISDETCIDHIDTDAISALMLHWPTFNNLDMEYCLSIQKKVSVSIHVYCRDISILNPHNYINQNIYFHIYPKCYFFERINEPQQDTINQNKEYFDLNISNRSVNICGVETHLSRREFDLLKFLFTRAKKIITREEIINEIWNGIASDSNVYITIKKLRSKIEKDPKKPKHLITKRGGGYLLNI